METDTDVQTTEGQIAAFQAGIILVHGAYPVKTSGELVGCQHFENKQSNDDTGNQSSKDRA